MHVNRTVSVQSGIHLCMISLFFVSTLIYCTHANAANQVDISYYFDDRDFNTLTLFMLNKDLGGGFSFLGFTDFHSDHQNSTNRNDATRTFSEFRLSNNMIAKWWNIDNLGLQLEYNDSTPGNNNNAVRLGLTYNQSLNASDWLQLRVFPLDSQNDGQVSIIYFVKFTENFNLSGFADYNFISDGKNQWVFEPQLNYKLYSKLWLLLEYRYNGFENSNPNLDGSGTALGLRYDF